MSNCNTINVGNDRLTLVKVPSRPSGLDFVAKFSLPPRCDHFSTPFEHGETVTLYVLEGTIQLDIDGKVRKIQKDSYADIEAGQQYRLMGVEFHKSAIVLAYFSSISTIDDWVKVSTEVNQRGQRHRDGVTRYR